MIDFLLTTYVMPRRLTAELHHALGALPRVPRPARSRCGSPPRCRFRIRAGTTKYEIILYPRTYRLMRDNDSYYGASAILYQARVTGPGMTH